VDGFGYWIYTATLVVVVLVVIVVMVLVLNVVVVVLMKIIFRNVSFHSQKEVLGGVFRERGANNTVLN
jgi:hypothetical protein